LQEKLVGTSSSITPGFSPVIAGKINWNLNINNSGLQPGD